MNLKQALKRIEELEQRVKILEAQPREVHHHYPVDHTVYQPIYAPPAWRDPPFHPRWEPMCGSDVVIGSLTGGAGARA